jgi:uncharacterized protein YjiS (DUF1127 family)
MLAIDRDNVEYSTGPALQQIGRAVAAPAMSIARRLRLDRVVYWIQDEVKRAALVRELSQLNDYYLRDIGIHRADIDDIADMMVKRRRESRAR